MSKTKNIKIGMAGLMTHPFSGPKEQYFFEDSQKIKEISEKLGAEVIIFSKGIYDLRSAKDAALEFHRQCRPCSFANQLFFWRQLHSSFS
jgi:hypothetical protein